MIIDLDAHQVRGCQSHQPNFWIKNDLIFLPHIFNYNHTPMYPINLLIMSKGVKNTLIFEAPRKFTK